MSLEKEKIEAMLAQAFASINETRNERKNQLSQGSRLGLNLLIKPAITRLTEIVTDPSTYLGGKVNRQMFTSREASHPP
jgi:hypothetical protein